MGKFRRSTLLIITGKSKEILETKVKRLVEEFLSHRGLTLSVGKTKITHIENGFDFLGQTVRKYGTKIIIKPSVESISRLLKSVRCLIRKNGAETQEKVIETLSPQIRGWTYYHRGICARKAYEKVDHEIFKALWQWLKRKHPNKGLRWIKRKYFKVIETRKWCFATLINNKGAPEWKELFQATSVSIRRHKKIRANPYDKEWYSYFKERKSNNSSLHVNDNIGLMYKEFDMSKNSKKIVAGSHVEDLRWLEPYEGKLSSTVPRGGFCG